MRSLKDRDIDFHSLQRTDVEAVNIVMELTCMNLCLAL